MKILKEYKYSIIVEYDKDAQKFHKWFMRNFEGRYSADIGVYESQDGSIAPKGKKYMEVQIDGFYISPGDIFKAYMNL